MRFLFVLTLASILGSEVLGEITFKKGSPHVKLPSGGSLKGKVERSRDGLPYNSFFGVKYAHIPERFSDARLIENEWSGAKSAVEKPPVCSQSAFLIKSADGDMNAGEEDCLYLNVHVPMSTKPRDEGNGLPVMVWIHGGGFMWGDGYSYGPKFLMDEEIIVVTINYRLGVFGFLSTGDDVASGNYGLKDCILALKWIQKNIESFGGDAGKVTVFGESAGGAATSYLLLSPMAKGLFQRVISQSGTPLDNWAYQPNPKKTVVELAEFLKCPTSSSQEIVNCLRKTPMKELNMAQLTFNFHKTWPTGNPSIPFGPTNDNHSPNPFLTDSPFTTFDGKHELPIKDVPWMVGLIEEEAIGMAQIILTNETLVKELDTKWNELAPTAFGFRDHVLPSEHLDVAKKIKEFYFGSKGMTAENKNSLVQAYSDFNFNYGIVKAVIESLKSGGSGPVYLYQFGVPAPVALYEMIMPLPEEAKKKAGHGDELLFLFDLEPMAVEMGVGTDKLPFIKPDSKDEDFSRKMVKMWAAFAKEGKPTYTWGSSSWSPLSQDEVKDSSSLKWYRIDADPKHIDDPYSERYQFWDKLYKDHYLKVLTAHPSQQSGRTEL